MILVSTRVEPEVVHRSKYWRELMEGVFVVNIFENWADWAAGPQAVEPPVVV